MKRNVKELAASHEQRSASDCILDAIRRIVSSVKTREDHKDSNPVEWAMVPFRHLCEGETSTNIATVIEIRVCGVWRR